jgi:adenylylsulfate kinase-like enzyme
MTREKQRTDTRDAPRDIYTKGASGWPVPGVAVPYEEPLHPEIVIETEKVGLHLIRERIKREITKIKGP